MNDEELNRIVRIMANQCFVRYWRHYNYPNEPKIGAMAFIDADGNNVDIYRPDFPQLENKEEKDGINFYTFKID